MEAIRTSDLYEAAYYLSQGFPPKSIKCRKLNKELDKETGLYYYGARYYEPKLARWMSADPAGFALINPMDADGKDSWEPLLTVIFQHGMRFCAYFDVGVIDG